MNNRPLQEKSFDFAVRMVNLYKFLSIEKKEFVISKQMLRSGTAIGALAREADQAESKADFIHKLSIALKEANETEYWLLLMCKTDYLKVNEFESLHTDLKELLKLLTSIINSTKKNLAAT
ncbi:MAG: four helix bundle protein [Anaerolineae bacterium]|nr:four helix bundle protein [Anaerolineae bacterium]